MIQFRTFTEKSFVPKSFSISLLITFHESSNLNPSMKWKLKKEKKKKITFPSRDLNKTEVEHDENVNRWLFEPIYPGICY